MIYKKRDKIEINERNENKCNDKKICHRSRKRLEILENTNENIEIIFYKNRNKI
jgi:hypothetical protein